MNSDDGDRNQYDIEDDDYEDRRQSDSNSESCNYPLI